MPKFDLTVTETVAITKLYTVEAETRQEAIEKAERGDTVFEADACDLPEVIGRAVWED